MHTHACWSCYMYIFIRTCDCQDMNKWSDASERDAANPFERDAEYICKRWLNMSGQNQNYSRGLQTKFHFFWPPFAWTFFAALSFASWAYTRRRNRYMHTHAHRTTTPSVTSTHDTHARTIASAWTRCTAHPTQPTNAQNHTFFSFLVIGSSLLAAFSILKSLISKTKECMGGERGTASTPLFRFTHALDTHMALFFAHAVCVSAEEFTTPNA